MDVAKVTTKCNNACMMSKKMLTFAEVLETTQTVELAEKSVYNHNHEVHRNHHYYYIILAMLKTSITHSVLFKLKTQDCPVWTRREPKLLSSSRILDPASIVHGGLCPSTTYNNNS